MSKDKDSVPFLHLTDQTRTFLTSCPLGFTKFGHAATYPPLGETDPASWIKKVSEHFNRISDLINTIHPIEPKLIQTLYENYSPSKANTCYCEPPCSNCEYSECKIPLDTYNPPAIIPTDLFADNWELGKFKTTFKLNTYLHQIIAFAFRLNFEIEQFGVSPKDSACNKLIAYCHIADQIRLVVRAFSRLLYAWLHSDSLQKECVLVKMMLSKLNYWIHEDLGHFWNQHLTHKLRSTLDQLTPSPPTASSSVYYRTHSTSVSNIIWAARAKSGLVFSPGYAILPQYNMAKECLTLMTSWQDLVKSNVKGDLSNAIWQTVPYKNHNCTRDELVPVSNRCNVELLACRRAKDRSSRPRKARRPTKSPPPVPRRSPSRQSESGTSLSSLEDLPSLT